MHLHIYYTNPFFNNINVVYHSYSTFKVVMIAWGVTMCAMAAIHNTAGLLASRFFLGITGKTY